MISRHRSRHRALQVLYQVDLRGLSADEALSSYYETLYSEEHEEKPEPDPFMESLVRETTRQLAEIDQIIQKHSENWRLERMPAVDRNILRMAVYELREKKLAPAVVIDEALELAHRFSGDDSVRFLNGVLDSIRKTLNSEDTQ